MALKLFDTLIPADDYCSDSIDAAWKALDLYDEQQEPITPANPSGNLAIYVKRRGPEWQVQIVEPEPAEPCPGTRVYINTQAAAEALNGTGDPFRCNRGHVHAFRKRRR